MNILCLSPIDSEAEALLGRGHDLISVLNAGEGALLEAVRDTEILIFRSGVTVSAEMMDAAPHLKLLLRAGSGLDNIDLEYVGKRGLRLVRIPGPSANSVAELAFGLMLTLARKIALADRLLRQGRWPKPELGGPLLTGKTLGVIGLGNIGTRVAELGVAWGMHSIGCVKQYSKERAATLSRQGIELMGHLDDVLTQADFVSIHVPRMPETMNLIDARALSLMKSNSYLINTARGGIVDEAALYHDLTNGDRLSGAALDVHEREGEGTLSPLGELPNVVLTPHIGGMASDSQREIGRRLTRIIEAFVKGRLETETGDGELVA